MPPLDGRRLRLKLVITMEPSEPNAPSGHTDAARETAKRIALETGLIAHRLGEGCIVTVDREITVT